LLGFAGAIFGDNFTLPDLGGLLDGLGDISIPGFEGILGGDVNVTSILDGIQDVVSGLLNGTSAINFTGLIEAVQECDVEAWIPLGEACTAAQLDSETACPDECKQLFDVRCRLDDNSLLYMYLTIICIFIDTGCRKRLPGTLYLSWH
jgi:hypothetical protein